MDAPQAGPAGKLLAGLIVVAVLVAGVIFWGRVANDDRLAMLFTSLWFGAVLAGGYLATRARTELRVPMALGFAVVAVATTILVGLPMFQTDEVNERVVTGEPVSETSRDEQSEQDAEGERPPRNVELARGRFVGLTHPGSGVAAVVALAEGGHKLTLTKFATDNGPDLRVYLSTKNPAHSGELGEFKDMGALKGNAGDQQYDIPRGFDLERFSNVVIWCRAFSVGFTSASLETS
jgi:hypothetical protein